MLFNSLAFLYFFASLFLISYLSPQKWTKVILLIASIFFYSYWYPPYLILLLISVAIDYWTCIKIEDARLEQGVKVEEGINEDHRPSHAIGHGYMLLSVVLNLLILFGFKYIHFAASIFDFNLPESFRWALPLGISFFTFQTMACTIDVYRGQVSAKRNFTDFLLYICFFPQLIAGPILRLQESWNAIMSPTKASFKSLNAGLYLIFWGLLKKMLIADNLGIYVEKVFADPESINNGLVAWLGIYCFALQIYCDFSGYVDTALGVAKVFGIEIPINFDFPYISKSITEFWRRWHITLSTWLKDYLYIPLGGNRKGAVRTDMNLLMTMLLGGLWHGANWTFVVWGLLHGIYLSIEKFLYKTFNYDLVVKEKSFVPDLIRQIICFNLVCVSWVFFRAANLDQALVYLGKMLETFDWSLFSSFEAQQALVVILIAWAAHLMNYHFDIKNKLATWRPEFRLIFLVFAIMMIMVFGVKQEMRFIYFDF